MSERIASLLRGWDDITDHRTGTRGDRRTAEWLAAEMRLAGAEPLLDAFPFERRIVGDAFVEISGRRVDGLPCFDGGETAGIIEAPLRPVGAGTGIGVGSFSAATFDADTAALASARQANEHTALIGIASGTRIRPGLAVMNAESYGRPFGPPLLQIATEYGPWLREAARTGHSARLGIRFGTELTEACNVQATVTGRRPDLPPLVVMTPRSSWWVSTSERGGGIVVWLKALRQVARAPALRNVIFTANTGHELGHLGLAAWLERNGMLVREAHTWVHLGANFAARGGELRYQASSPELLDLGLGVLAGHGITPERVTPPGQRPLGEARNISDGGGRYLSLLGTNPLFHHPDDRWPDAVDLERTEVLTRVMLRIIDVLSNTP